MKSNLEPGVKGLALKSKAITKRSLEKSLSWAKRHYKDYSNYVVNYTKTRKVEHNLQFILRELLFQGFIPEEKFTKKPECNYIITNRLIFGKRYIYPEHFGHDFSIINKGYRNIYEAINYIGVSGYTKVDVKFTRIKEENGGNNKGKKRRK